MCVLSVGGTALSLFFIVFGWGGEGGGGSLDGGGRKQL